MPWSPQSIRSQAYGLLAALLMLACLGAAPASAQRYRVVGGEVSDAGAVDELRGSLEFGVSGLSGLLGQDPGVSPFEIVDFDLSAGDAPFAPRLFHTFEGLGSAGLTFHLPDALELEDDRVSGLALRAGGVVTATTADTVTFRDWDLDGSTGEALDRAASGGGLPVRFVASGTLTATDTTYSFTCPSGVLITQGGPVTGDVTLTSITIEAAIPILGEQPPVGGGATITAIPVLTIPFGVTLEDLGISAPEGAEITVYATGHVTVESDGDLQIDAGVLDIPGLTRLTIVSLGTITVGPLGIHLPDDVALELEAPVLDIQGPIDVPAPPGDPIACEFMVPIDRQQGVPQPFVLEAALEVPVEIRLLGGARRWRSPPVFWRTLSIVILGSDELNVRDVDVASLRFGPGRAEVLSTRWGRQRSLRRDLNRDGHADLIVRFASSEVALALGETEVCLTGATVRGPALAGCLAIDAGPQPKPQPRSGALGRLQFLRLR